MLDEQVKTTGELTITLRGPDGNIKEQKTVPNLVVAIGKNLIASRLAGFVSGANNTMSHMAVGTGTSSPVSSETTLKMQIANSRVPLTSTVVETGSNVVTYTATFGAGIGTGAITEAGIFNSSTAGVMLCRTVFFAVNKDISDSLTINWSITIS